MKANAESAATKNDTSAQLKPYHYYYYFFFSKKIDVKNHGIRTTL